MKNLLLLVFLFTEGLSSCNQSFDEDLVETKQVQNELRFSYKGNYYSSNYLINEDGSIDLFNESVNLLYAKIQEEPNLVTVVGDTLSFYDSEEDMLRESATSDVSLRSAGTNLWELKAYTSTKYRGEIERYSTRGNYGKDIVSYNNNWGSLYMKVYPISSNSSLVYFRFYEDGYCEGRSLVFKLNLPKKPRPALPGQTAHDGSIEMSINDLGDYHRASWGRDWDNKISSFRVECY